MEPSSRTPSNPSSKTISPMRTPHQPSRLQLLANRVIPPTRFSSFSLGQTLSTTICSLQLLKNLQVGSPEPPSLRDCSHILWRCTETTWTTKRPSRIFMERICHPSGRSKLKSTRRTSWDWQGDSNFDRLTIGTYVFPVGVCLSTSLVMNGNCTPPV